MYNRNRPQVRANIVSHIIALHRDPPDFGADRRKRLICQRPMPVPSLSPEEVLMAASNPAADTSMANAGSKSKSRKARKSSEGFSRFIAGFAGGLVATASLMPATASVAIVAAYVILNGP